LRPEPHTQSAYVAAFAEIVRRIAATLVGVPPAILPIRMVVADGAALHFYTGVRVSVDVDAVFSRRIALPQDLDVAYLDPDGAPRLLYFDRQYNDTFGLLHEDADDDSCILELDGVDPGVLEVRLLTPLDLAVSKLGRYSSQDRADIAALAERGLVHAQALERRATAALGGYVGDIERVRANLVHALRSFAEPRTDWGSGGRGRDQDGDG
jgi:hypothetical protein